MRGDVSLEVYNRVQELYMSILIPEHGGVDDKRKSCVDYLYNDLEHRWSDCDADIKEIGTVLADFARHHGLGDVTHLHNARAKLTEKYTNIPDDNVEVSYRSFFTEAETNELAVERGELPNYPVDSWIYPIRNDSENDYLHCKGPINENLLRKPKSKQLELF